ncbi:hypothetical protein CHL_0216 [Campylobacter hyointestinalis subsp. lawsonii CCUG 27631]|nr:hypothetical protein CHL_0216 [Campylobacter hyointestinalis subsp. lawsonii CCUG 27631]
MPSLNFGKITSLSFIFCGIANLCLLCFFGFISRIFSSFRKKLSKAVKPFVSFDCMVK